MDITCGFVTRDITGATEVTIFSSLLAAHLFTCISPKFPSSFPLLCYMRSTGGH